MDIPDDYAELARQRRERHTCWCTNCLCDNCEDDCLYCDCCEYGQEVPEDEPAEWDGRIDGG